MVLNNVGPLMSLGLITLSAPHHRAGLSSLRSSLYMEDDLLDNLYMAVRRDGIRWFGNMLRSNSSVFVPKISGCLRFMTSTLFS